MVSITNLFANDKVGLSRITINDNFTALNTGKQEKTFETINKNLDNSNATMNYTGINLTSIVYANGIVKTLNYLDNRLTSVVLSGATPSGIVLTKTFNYTGENLTSITYS